MTRKLVLAGFALLTLTSALAQEAAKDERAMSREERIKAHQERIEKIIEANKKKQEEEAAKAKQRVQNATPAPGAPPAPGGPAVTPQPGQPLPTGPVTAYKPTAPGAAPPPPQPVGAAGARSESRSMVSIKPFDSVVNTGETFATDIIADTKNTKADEVSIRLRYPKGILNPLAIDHTRITPFIKGDLEYGVDENEGLLYLRAQLKEPLKLIERSIVRIIWEATAPTAGSAITFEFGKKQTTGLYLQKINFLGTSADGADGVINGTVMVRNPKAKTIVQKIGDRDLLIGTNRYATVSKTMQLSLDTPTQTVREGQEFDVAVVLRNEENAPFDRLQLYIQFNPKDLEVVDSDRGNWIRRDVNIRDGFAHNQFPFDFHRSNIADNEAGFILYDEAAEMKAITGTGTVAQIRFRAKRPVDQTEVYLVTNPDADVLNTKIVFMGSSTLTSQPQRLAALDALGLTIQRRSVATAR